MTHTGGSYFGSAAPPPSTATGPEDQAPGPQMPGPQMPGPQMPGPQMPGPQMPGPQMPGAQVPGPQMPGAQMPGPQPPAAEGDFASRLPQIGQERYVCRVRRCFALHQLEGLVNLPPRVCHLLSTPLLTRLIASHRLMPPPPS